MPSIEYRRRQFGLCPAEGALEPVSPLPKVDELAVMVPVRDPPSLTYLILQYLLT